MAGVDDQIGELRRLSSDYEKTERTEAAVASGIPEISTGELMTQFLSVGFGLVAVRAGEHWVLSTDEAEIAGNAYGDVLDKYFPDLSGMGGVEVTAVMVTGSLMIPRMMANKPKETTQENNDNQVAATGGIEETFNAN